MFVKYSYRLTYLVTLLVVGTFVSCQNKSGANQDSASEPAKGNVLAIASSNLGIDEADLDKMVYVKGGTLNTKDYETGDAKQIAIKPFYIDKNLVTVADFKAFTKATGYVTEAQKFGNSTVFDFKTGEWILKDGAYYLYPFGPDQPKADPNHPVTQVSWNDAVAYAKYKKKRLPEAAEWEWAAKSGGESNSTYSWGNAMQEGTSFKANFWQGEFPSNNTKEDGFLTTSPVGYFGANPLGLYDMGGNVWQWTADKVAPTLDEAQLDTATRIVTKGGSFLCDPEVCHGFKVNGKSSSTAETGMVHTGFRCVKDI